MLFGVFALVGSVDDASRVVELLGSTLFWPVPVEHCQFTFSGSVE